VFPMPNSTFSCAQIRCLSGVLRSELTLACNFHPRRRN
jgi:hypothetical protein